MSDAYGPPATWSPVLWSCDISTTSPVVSGSAAAAATEIVWALSGRQFGLRQVTLRPCRTSCADTPFPDGWMPWPGSIPPPMGAPGPVGYWFPTSCTSCGGNCSCTILPEILLPSPVASVVNVKVDGSPMPTGSYRLDDSRRLVRTDGSNWPYCQNLLLDDTNVGTWSVTAVYGRDVPVSGLYAVGEMACQFLRAWKGEDCRLPRNVTQIAKQGITISMPAINELLKDGKTGLPLVDYFLGAYNPSGARGRSKVFAVDQPPMRRAGV